MEVEDSLDLLLTEFEQSLHNLTRDIYKVQADNGKIGKLCDQIGTLEDSHDLRAKINALVDVNKESIKSIGDRLQHLSSKIDTLPVTNI